jgi:hypothetical protein
LGASRSYCEEANPDVFDNGTIQEQLNYIQERTRIYENFRAVREDMFKDISRNTLDTLRNAKSRINGLMAHNAVLDSRIDSLRKSLITTNDALLAMTNTKDSISVLGMEVNKRSYNSVVWTIIAILVLLLVVGFLLFRQNRAITVRTRKDLADLKQAYDDYHTKSRLDREKMNIEHFNEIKRLKEGSKGLR